MLSRQVSFGGLCLNYTCISCLMTDFHKSRNMKHAIKLIKTDLRLMVSTSFLQMTASLKTVKQLTKCPRIKKRERNDLQALTTCS